MSIQQRRLAGGRQQDGRQLNNTPEPRSLPMPEAGTENKKPALFKAGF
ncbi:hypothetical protein H9K76_01990 [Diaphorobacter ruginosibacter]|uniref:Uncharacterized protein n=1 Tax=Diaphorobacter ruginosibacter TaxID=1715720 RepID=A0A7G9RQ13_9BURK|nr:hypothetical protein [Diaphorobacter ruginosibacter]QNN57688.1 hypothetical protein H9K76_01990 [Diaphorobacter ruginosibacter]